MDITKVLTLTLLAAPAVVAIALAISTRRSMTKVRQQERLNARIMFRGHMAKVDAGTTPSRIFRAGYRSALMEHAPHKLAEFDADWPHDMDSRP